MKPVNEWDENFILGLPLGEFDWFEAEVDPILWTTKWPKEMKLLCQWQAVSACKCTSAGVWYDRL